MRSCLNTNRLPPRDRRCISRHSRLRLQLLRPQSPAILHPEKPLIPPSHQPQIPSENLSTDSWNPTSDIFRRSPGPMILARLLQATRQHMVLD